MSVEGFLYAGKRKDLELSRNKSVIHAKHHIWVQAINCKHAIYSCGGGSGHTKKGKKKRERETKRKFHNA